MSFHLSTSTLSFVYLLQSVPNLIDQLLGLEPIIVAVLVCTLLLIVIVVSQIISSIVICLLLCHDMTHFRYLLIVLIAGASVLQEQVIRISKTFFYFILLSVLRNLRIFAFLNFILLV